MGADLIGDWFDENRRDLPWRAADRTPWGVLVSEVMLQQTPVVRVVPAWTAWMTRWPQPADLAAESPGEAVRQWDRLGYPRRALNLHAASLAIVERHDGRSPTRRPTCGRCRGSGSTRLPQCGPSRSGGARSCWTRTCGGSWRGWSTGRSTHPRA